jgi:hypothetical protein
VSNGRGSSLTGFVTGEDVDQYPIYCGGDKCSDAFYLCHKYPCSIAWDDADEGA